MKKKTKILYSLGALPVIVAPIATTISMSTDTPTVIDFYNKVNTTSKSDLTKAQFDSLKNTQWFKDNYSKMTATDREGFFKAIIALMHSNEIQDSQKVSIAKFTQDHYTYLNFMNEFGFDKFAEIHQVDENATQGKNLIFDGTSATNILQQNNSISLNGATGINLDNPNIIPDPQKGQYDLEKTISISNQDVLNYFSLALTSTSKFNDLLKFVDTAKKQLNAGLTTLPQAWTTYIAKAKETLAPFIAANSVSEARIKATNIFKVFDTVDTSTLSDDNDFFKTIIESDLGKYFHASDSDRASLVNDYLTNPDQDDKNIQNGNIFKSIEIALKSLIGNKSTLMNNAIMKTTTQINGVPTTVNEFKSKKHEVEWTDLVAQMVKFSGGFKEGIEMVVQTNLLLGDAIGIKTGFIKQNLANKLLPSELKLRMENIELGNTSDYQVFGSYRNQEMNQIGQISSVPAANATLQVDRSLNELKYEIASEPKYVMGVGSASWFQTSIKAELVSVDNNNYEQVVQTVIFDGLKNLYENDHDADDAIKNVESPLISAEYWTPNTSSYPAMIHHPAVYGPEAVVPWIVNVPSAQNGQFTWTNGKIANQPKFYLRFTKGSAVDQTTFKELTDAVNDAVKKEFEKQTNHLQDIKDNKISNDLGIDVTANHDISISLKSITFGEIRFNTYDDSGYDDTHSDHFRFQKVSAHFEVNITEK